MSYNSLYAAITMSVLNIRLPEDLEAHLAEEARLEQKPRSQIAREALAWYLRERDRQRFLAAMAEEARQISAQEAAEIEREFSDADAEALHVAESPPTMKR